MKPHILLPVTVIVMMACNTARDRNAHQDTTANKNAMSAPPKVDTTTTLAADTGTIYFKASDGNLYLVSSEIDSTSEIEMPVAEKAMPTSRASAASTTSNEPCESDMFDGSDRRSAKTSIASGNLEDYDNLQQFMQTLVPDNNVSNYGSISTGATSTRLSIERRNVYIRKAWIYAFKRESDEDYHVIIGTTANKSTAKFFNIEISGLPAAGSYRARLASARNAFENFFGIHGQCIRSYKKFMSKPVMIECKGSLFFDKLHYDQHGAIGPSEARGNSYWEIHPVTYIRFIPNP